MNQFGLMGFLVFTYLCLIGVNISLLGVFIDFFMFRFNYYKGFGCLIIISLFGEDQNFMIGGKNYRIYLNQIGGICKGFILIRVYYIIV